MRTRKQEEIVIYTLGTSQRSLEEFLEILAFYRIEQVADVRSFPSSRRYPHFCREELAQALAAAGIRYLWLGKELGGFRKEGYEAYTRTGAFQEGLEKLLSLARQATTAIICAEKLPWRCHRRFIARALEERGVRVLHVLERGKLWEPKKNPSLGLMFPS